MSYLQRLVVAWLLVATVNSANLEKSIGRSSIVQNVGPNNITRLAGEKNVFIPCTFSGQDFPIWKINGSYFIESSLPSGLIQASYGLLVPYVSVALNGTSFQCFVSDVTTHQTLSSSIGILTINGYVSPDVLKNFEIMTLSALSTPESDYLFIDYQRTIFYKDVKVITWKNTSTSDCGGYPTQYQVALVTCNDTDTEKKAWPKQGDTSRNVSSEDVHQAQIDQLAFMKIEAYNSVQAVCKTTKSYLHLTEEDITGTFHVPYDGFCFEFETDISDGIVSVIIPKNSTNAEDESDCFCPISHVTIMDCGCIDDTMFKESLYVSNITTNNIVVYQLCFSGLKSEMNNTVIHTITFYRYCKFSGGQLENDHVPYIDFLKSFIISIVRPNDPTVQYNGTSKVVRFFSDNNHDVIVDHYQVIIQDITSGIILNNSYGANVNHLNLSDILEDLTCAPYNIFVQAHTSNPTDEYGENVFTVPLTMGDSCMCIEKTVRVDVDLIGEDKVRVNCSQTGLHMHYLSNTNFTVITDKQNMSFSTSCRNDSDIIKFNSGTLTCDQSYTLQVYWVSDQQGSGCILGKKDTAMLPCPSQTLKIVSISFGVFGVITAVVIVSLMAFVYYLRNRNGGFLRVQGN